MADHMLRTATATAISRLIDQHKEAIVKLRWIRETVRHMGAPQPRKKPASKIARGRPSRSSRAR